MWLLVWVSCFFGGGGFDYCLYLQLMLGIWCGFVCGFLVWCVLGWLFLVLAVVFLVGCFVRGCVVDAVFCVGCTS